LGVPGSRFWVLEKQDEYEGLCWNFVGWVSGFGQSGSARRLKPKGLKGSYMKSAHADFIPPEHRTLNTERFNKEKTAALAPSQGLRSNRFQQEQLPQELPFARPEEMEKPEP